MNHRFVLPIVGPAGCGKGTCCTFLEGLGAHVLTTSAVLEDHSKRDAGAGKIIHEYKHVLKQNVPDEIASAAMIGTLRRLFRQVHSGLFGLDGFGRGPDQFTRLAEWIENRNAHYEQVGLPLIKRGAVFLTLTEKETMRRVQKRVEEALARGETPRATDLGDIPKQRYDEYAPIQERLKKVAESTMGLVTIIDLGEYSTLEAAAMIYGMTHESDPKVIAMQLRERFQEVA